MADQRARRERALADGPLAGGLAQRRFDEFVGLAIGRQQGFEFLAEFRIGAGQAREECRTFAIVQLDRLLEQLVQALPTFGTGVGRHGEPLPCRQLLIDVYKRQVERGSAYRTGSA